MSTRFDSLMEAARISADNKMMIRKALRNMTEPKRHYSPAWYLWALLSGDLDESADWEPPPVVAKKLPVFGGE